MSNKKLVSGSLDSALSIIGQEQKRIDDMLKPQRLDQEEVNRILGPNNIIETLFASDQWMETVSSNRPWGAIYESLKTASSFSEKKPLWEEITKFQTSIFDMPDHVSEALTGLKLNQSSLGFLAAGLDPKRLNEIYEALSLDSILIGEFDINESPEIESADESVEGSRIILPGEFQERFKTVKFMPLTLYNKVIDDPALMREIDPRDFEYFVADLIQKLGFDDVDVTPQSNDGGRDVIATRTVNGIKMLFAFECKRYAESRTIGPSIMRSLIGTVNQKDTQANMGVLVTTSSFTPKSRTMIASEAAIDGRDFNDLVDWIEQVRKA